MKYRLYPITVLMTDAQATRELCRRWHWKRYFELVKVDQDKARYHRHLARGIEKGKV